VAVDAQIASNSSSDSASNTVPVAAKIRPAIGSGGYIAVGPVGWAIEGSGTARAMRDAGDTSSEILRSRRADTTLMMQWLARKRSSARVVKTYRDTLQLNNHWTPN